MHLKSDSKLPWGALLDVSAFFCLVASSPGITSHDKDPLSGGSLNSDIEHIVRYADWYVCDWVDHASMPYLPQVIHVPRVVICWKQLIGWSQASWDGMFGKALEFVDLTTPLLFSARIRLLVVFAWLMHIQWQHVPRKCPSSLLASQSLASSFVRAHMQPGAWCVEDMPMFC